MYNPDNDDLEEEEDEDLSPAREIWDLPEEAVFYCRFCGEQVERFYANLEGTILGCNNCVMDYDPYTKSRCSCSG